MEPLFVKTFWITVIMLWVALIILYFILTDRKSLERKGHNEKYIEYIRKSHLIRICIIAVLLPLLILFSAWIVFLITGNLYEEVQLAYIVVVLIVLVVPFKLVDERINQKRIKELALDTKEKIAVDLNYQTLHLIFNPLWEIFLAPAALLYGILYLRIEQWIIYFFLLIPWLMYLTIRGTRYQTRPYLKDNYKYMFAFNIFNFLFFLFYFDTYFLMKIRDSIDFLRTNGSSISFAEFLPSLLLLVSGLVIILGLMSRIAIYLANYRAFNRAISGESDSLGSSFSRKLLFTIVSVAILFTMMGMGMMTGLAKDSRIEVGVVQQKFVIDDFRGIHDTLLIVDQIHPGIDNDLNHLLSGEHLRLHCDVTLSKTNRIKSYEICCPATFKELPVGTIVKFEYGAGPSITRLIDY